MKEVVKVRAGWVWGEGKVLKTLENSIKVVQNKGLRRALWHTLVIMIFRGIYI